MSHQHLTLAKNMRLVHGKMRPYIAVRANIDPAAKTFLLAHFASETLFKRTAYVNGFTDGGLQASPALERMLASFVRNDACPEITVKTLTAGQTYEGANLWDLQCFEFVAKRAFDSLLELAAGAAAFDGTQMYRGFAASAELAASGGDTALEMAARPTAIPVGGKEGMAHAA